MTHTATTETCSCGTPSEATYYVSAVIGHEDNMLGGIGYIAALKADVSVDARDVDGYYCGRHVPSRRDMLPDELARYNFAVLQYKRTKLR